MFRTLGSDIDSAAMFKVGFPRSEERFKDAAVAESDGRGLLQWAEA